MRKFDRILLIIGIFMIVNMGVYAWGFGREEAIVNFGDITSIIISGFAFTSFGYLLYFLAFPKTQRLIWELLCTGLLFYFLGELIWGITPYPSLADIFWLIGYLPFFIALLLYRKEIGAKLERYEFLILSVTTLFFAGISFYFLIIPIASNETMPFLEKFLNIAYPVGDLFLLIPSAMIVILFGKGVWGKPWLFICLGFLSFSIADSVYSYLNINGLYKSGNFIDLVWVLGYAFMALAVYYRLYAIDE
ncbi:MAG: hypothetical protein HY776_04310 [Actinobacteria bacterium]|nr:hypothetical protein [Actinomycetota bacterium]